jgi:predicted nicotinamide N-methyase
MPKQKHSESNIPALTQILSSVRSSPLQVVELGAGCGIVGIALASMLPNCSVLLTDLPEVESIITRNIEEAQTAPQSSVGYQNLDWDNPPDDLCNRPIELILVSDCTYNADSLPALVNVLDRLVRTSPDAIILVALKRRHDSETVFFDLMGSAGFTAAQDSLQLPSQHDQVDEIEFYCYRRTTASQK